MSALSPEADMLIVGINVCKCHKQTLGPSDATSPLLRLKDWNFVWGVYTSSAAPAEALGSTQHPQRVARKAAP